MLALHFSRTETICRVRAARLAVDFRRLALDNFITVGMIFAFVSYKLQFARRTELLIEKLVDLRILGLHLERWLRVVRLRYLECRLSAPRLLRGTLTPRKRLFVPHRTP
jgi:hypothetical protein